MRPRHPAVSTRACCTLAALGAAIALPAAGGIACSTGERLDEPSRVDANGDGAGDDGAPDALDRDADICETGTDGPIACPNGHPLPTVGAACGPGIGDCTWPGGCGLDHFRCCGRWERTGEPRQSCSLCPSVPPTAGDSCAADELVCGYANPLVYCERTAFDCTNGVWHSKFLPCAAGCPPGKPKTGDSCSSTSEGKLCEWSSDCHSIAYGLCTAGTWAATVPCP